MKDVTGASLAAGADGTIYLAYETGAKSPYEKITVARFNVEWLIQGDAPAKTKTPKP